MNNKYKVRKYLIAWTGQGSCGMSTFTRRADTVGELKELIKDVKSRYKAKNIKLYKYINYVDNVDDLDLFVLRSQE